MQSKVLDNGNLHDEKKYWINKLSDLPMTRYLPYSFLNNNDGTRSGRSNVKVTLNDFISNQIIKISRNSEIKIFSILTTCLEAFIFRYDYRNELNCLLWTSTLQQSDTSFNTRGCVGIRNKISSHMNFKNLLFLVDETIEDANENSNYPVDQILTELGYKPKVNGAELFDISIIYENIHQKGNSQLLNYNLVFRFSKEQDKITCILDYDNIFYQKEDIERFILHFCNVANYLLENVNAKISEVPMLTEEEKHKLIVDFNNTYAEYPEEKSLVSQFYKQAEKTPFNEAVMFKNTTLSYKELNEKSNQLARKLQENGVGKNSVVALLLGRSQYIVISILAIMKAGGTYLPIDPSSPELRIKYMLDDSNAKLALSEQRYSNKVLGGYKVIDVRSEDIYQGESSNLVDNTSLDDLMDIIYTSGSTGEPKGVLVPFRGMVNIINWCVKELMFTPDDISLQLVSYAFDGFISNLFPAITSGALSVILDEEDSMNYMLIRDFIESKRVTNISLVPSMYRAILDTCKPGDLSSLRFIQLAGDKTDVGLINLSNRINSDILLVNAYGPTENSMSTTANIGLMPDNKVLIGKPVYNNKLFVLGKDNSLMPVGVPGELYVSGDGLAKGYLNNAELTNEKFVQNPFIKGEIMYKTGDLVKWCENGNLDFLGRIDSQVKIRGLRIETQEIENCILKLEFVKETAVIVKGDNGENCYLCAYVVLESSINAKDITVSEYRKHLLKYLPDYMIPSYFIPIKRMPLTPNGKLDIKALPEQDKNIKTSAEFAVPSTETERKLAKIWAALLEIDENQISIHDSFFDLGGNSIIMMHLANQINSEFGTQIKITDLFFYTTINKVSELIGNPNKETEDIMKFTL